MRDYTASSGVESTNSPEPMVPYSLGELRALVARTIGAYQAYHATLADPERDTDDPYGVKASRQYHEAMAELRKIVLQ